MIAFLSAQFVARSPAADIDQATSYVKLDKPSATTQFAQQQVRKEVGSAVRQQISIRIRKC